MAVIRALGRRGVPLISVCHAEDEYAAVSRHVTVAVRAPDPEADEAGYVDLVASVAARHPGGLLIPVSDPTLVLVSRHKELFEQHVRVGCMEWAAVNRCIDKSQTYATADAVGVPCPRTLYPRSVEELVESCGTLRLPCVVKPRMVHLFAPVFHCKMIKVHDRDSLVREWTAVHEAGFDALVQEFIPGPDHNGANYNAYMVEGEVWAECTAQKLRSYPNEIGSPRLVLSREIEEVRSVGRRILRGLGVQGFANVEFKRDDRNGVFTLMEVNGRHNMSAALAVRCGIDFPWIQYDHLLHGERPPALRAETGVYWISLANDLAEGAKLVARGQGSLSYFRPYPHRHVYDFLDPRDPSPFARLAADRLRRFGAKRLRRWRAGVDVDPGPDVPGGDALVLDALPAHATSASPSEPKAAPTPLRRFVAPDAAPAAAEPAA
jgi:predicted ATP-grasp superfamily ATP-dependent carboligase